jgi:plasmid stabilization system protein ParE
MRHVLNYSPEAREEFKEAAKWYEEQLPGLGEEFVEAVLAKIVLIEAEPERYLIRRSYYRETMTKRFPYIIVYRYNKTKRTVTISAIHHASRNPKNKYKR